MEERKTSASFMQREKEKFALTFPRVLFVTTHHGKNILHSEPSSGRDRERERESYDDDDAKLID